jgi:hypothetical protein
MQRRRSGSAHPAGEKQNHPFSSPSTLLSRWISGDRGSLPMAAWFSCASWTNAWVWADSSLSTWPIREGRTYGSPSPTYCGRWLSVIAYNLGNLRWRLLLAHRIGNWSLTSVQQRLAKTGGRLVKHARYYWLLLAESHLTRWLFGSMVRRIEGLPVPAA